MFSFLTEVVIISLSGAMAPGPLTALIISKGNQSPHAGAWIAIGHGIVEIPLMVALLFGAGRWFHLPLVQALIGILGAIILLIIAIGLFRSARQQTPPSTHQAHSPLLGGMLLTIGNPFFLVWWATIGLVLISRSASFGLVGFIAMILVHWLCDFGWDYFLSALSFRGGRFFGRRFQQIVFTFCGAVLLFFAGRLMLAGIHYLLT